MFRIKEPPSSFISDHLVLGSVDQDLFFKCVGFIYEKMKNAATDSFSSCNKATRAVGKALKKLFWIILMLNLLL